MSKILTKKKSFKKTVSGAIFSSTHLAWPNDATYKNSFLKNVSHIWEFFSGAPYPPTVGFEDLHSLVKLKFYKESLVKEIYQEI